MASIGYVRVSSVDQNTDRQLDGVALDEVFTDRVSGATTDRPELQAMLRHIRRVMFSTSTASTVWLVH